MTEAGEVEWTRNVGILLSVAAILLGGALIVAGEQTALDATRSGPLGALSMAAGVLGLGITVLLSLRRGPTS